MEGGGTVFPNIARTVFPSKGSVLFWYNLHSDGIRNEYTLHGGCPVIHGIKTSKYQSLISSYVSAKAHLTIQILKTSL